MITSHSINSPCARSLLASGQALPNQCTYHQIRRGARGVSSAFERSRVPEQNTDTGSEVEEVTAVLREWDKSGTTSHPEGQEQQQQQESFSRDKTGVHPAAATKSEEEKRREVAQALQQVQAALHSAERKLEDVPNLPSARPKRKVPQLVRTTMTAVRTAVLLAAAVLCHAYGPAVQIGSAIIVGGAIGFSGYRKGSLSASGAVAAAAVGATTLGASLRAGGVLLGFYLSSSRLTRLQEERKAVDDAFRRGGQRDWVQVFCNALIPAALAIVCACVGGLADWPLGAHSRLYTATAGAFLGYYACCCGDTWASEVGQLSEVQPRLVTSLRPVRKGTNGGVTPLGLGASLAGGLFIGIVFYCVGLISPAVRASEALFAAALRQWRLIPMGMGLGLVGSLVDSVLGATLQFTGFNRKTGLVTGKVGPEVVAISGSPFLTNNGVNLVSASTCAVLGAAAALRLF